MSGSRYAVRGGKIQNSRCEVNVVEHCNLSCRSCTHLSPVMRKNLVTPETVQRDLSILASVYHARWLRLLGGEPLLHPDLLDVIRLARTSGVADKVAIVSNGVLLPRMPAAFWQLIDAIEICLYPGHELSEVQLEQLQDTAARTQVDLRVIRVRTFRESYSELGTEDGSLINRIYRTCNEAHIWRCHTVADGYFYKCPQTYFLGQLGGNDHSRYRDGVKIEDSPDLRATLLAYLGDTNPLASCRNCLGTAGRVFAHTQLKRAQFREQQRLPTEALIDRHHLSMRRFYYQSSRVRLATVALRLPALRAGHRLK
jgi:organic radical activating enzyme